MWFGKNLRYLRLKAGLSQDSIGDLVGKNSPQFKDGKLPSMNLTWKLQINWLNFSM